MTKRIKAFLIHLAISLVILAAILYVVVYIWYPPPFFAADGGWHGVRIMIGVDLILGPLLTLMVYNPGKGINRLKFDLWVIAVIQVSALAAGAYVVADQRTRLVTFANTRFVSMSQGQIDESGVSKDVFETLKGQHPPLAIVDMPEDKNERNQVVISSLSGAPLFKRGERYQPLTLKNRLKIVEQGFDFDKVVSVTPGLEPKVEKFLKKIGKTADQVSALPLYCRYQILTLVMDRQSGEILDSIDISHDQLLASLAYERLNKEAEEAEQASSQ